MKLERPLTSGPMLRITLLGCLFVLATTSRGQLVVNPASDLQQLVETIAGQGVQVADPVLNCHVQGHGTFSYTGGLLNTQNGVLLTTGTIANAIGPNSTENTSFEQFMPGSALLNTVTGRTTHDACHLEFDLIPSGDTIKFNYAFASEEYAEWVGSQYSDVFGMFISGPGIVGDPGLGGDRNIALVPTTGEPVMINTVNAANNAAFFLDNTGNSQIQYDGLTRQLVAKSPVQPCATYHLKLVIADVSDRLFDSGLFIAPIRSNSVSMNAFTSNGLSYAIEGCNAGTVRFTREVNGPLPLPVTFYLGGTAINGTDYPLVGLNADPNTPHNVTIPANQLSIDIPFSAFADGLVEGLETIRIYLGSAACPGVRLDSLDLIVRDSLQLSVSAAQSICSGNAANLLSSGAISYAWSPAASLSNAALPGPVATPTATTTYTVTGTAGSCNRSLNSTVTVSNMALSAVVTRPLCQGQSNGILNLTVNGGVVPYAFAWTGPSGFTASTEDLVNIPAGTYTVTVTDGTACSRVQSFNVSAPNALSVSMVPTILPFGQNIACFGGNTGALDLTVNGGTAPYNVNWTGPNGFTQSIQDITGLSAGTYTVTVTDQNGCTAGGSYTLVQPPVLAPTIGSVSHVTCFGAANGSATVSISGGIPPYSYSWNTTPAQTTTTATGLPAGPRTVTVTDGYGCTTTANVTITQPAAPLSVSLTAQGNVIHCQGQSQQHGTATAVGNGGTAPYSYHWNTVPQQTWAAATFPSGGTYTATVTDANGCTATTTFTVNQPGTPTASSVQTNVSCFGTNTGTATITVSGGSNIQSAVWNTTPPQSGTSANNLPPGTWTLTTQHADGCQSQFSVTILGPSSPLTPTIGGGSITHVSCAGGSNGTATVGVSGGGAPYTYSWNTTPVQTNNTATGLAPGTYTVTVNDAFGCTSQANATITQPTPLSVSITGFTNVLCFGTTQGTADAMATGGTSPYSYSWNSTPPQSGPNATDLPAGTYTVTVTDAKGCTAMTNVNIGGPQFSISANFESYGNETCFGAADGFATVLASGGSNSFTYTWNTVPPTNGPTATGLAPGTYEVEIVDNNGCDTPKYHSITILGPPDALTLMLNETDASCTAATNGSIDLSVSGGVAPYTYLWTDEDGNTSATEDLTGLSPGDYTLSMIDAYGCMIDTIATISATNDLGLSAAIDQIPCQGYANGALVATVIAGAAPYTIAWAGPGGFNSANAAISGLQEGTYTVDVQDGNGCTANTTIDLIGTAPATVDLLPSTFIVGMNISCAGASDGAVDMTITGGTAPFMISWSDGLGFTSSDEDISALGAGVYQVTIVDANGCIVNDLINLVAPQPIDVNASLGLFNGTNVSCASAIDGSIDITVTGGTPSYSYAWDTGGTVEDLNGLASGSFAVTVTDVNGCTGTGNWTLNAPAPLNAIISPTIHPGGTGVSCSGATDGEFITTINGGTAPYTISWSGPGGFVSDQVDINGLLAGTYLLQVIDANGCVFDGQAVISSPTPLNTTLTSTSFNGGYNIPCAGGTTGVAVASISGGTPAYSYDWTGPGGFTATDASLSGLGAGAYQVTVMDALGCSISNTITLTEPLPLDIQTMASDAGFGYHVGCAGNDGAITTIVSGGTPVYQLDWTGPNGFASMDLDLMDLVAGNYHLAVTDANGCFFENNVLLTEPTPLGAALSPVATSCPGDDTGMITTVPNGGTAPYGYSWSGPNGFTSFAQDLLDLQAGDYSLTMTDAMGCMAIMNTQLTGPSPLSTGVYVAFYGQYNLQCIGDSTGVIELSPAGGTMPYTISVTGPNSYASNAEQHNGLIAGPYAVNITDANGCVMDTVITLNEPVQTMAISLDLSLYPSGTNVSCFEGSDGWIEANVIGGNGPFSFNWRGPDSLEFNTPNIYDIPAGNYSYELVVIDDNGCSLTTSVTLTQPDTGLYASSILSLYNGGHNLSCSDSDDGSIDLSVDGGSASYNYDWSGPSGFSTTNEDVTSLEAGTYTVTITDLNGCDIQQIITLTAPDTLYNSAISFMYPGGTTISCFSANDGSITSTFSGGIPAYTTIWTGPNGYTSTDANPSDLAPGTYCSTLTDSNGCMALTCVTIDEPLALSVTPTTTDAPCGASTGGVDLALNGGTAPYAFDWNTGDATQSLNALAPGTYSVTVTDANGCMVDATATVQGSSVMDLNANVTAILCNGDASGAIDLSVTGGAAPLSYTWNNGDAAEDIQALQDGSYTVTVIDALGCTSTGSWQVTQPSAIAITAIPSLYWNGYNVSNFMGTDGSIGLTVGGGNAPYTYIWSNNSTASAITGLSAGSYTVQVIDANGCSTSITVTLEEPNDLIMPTGYSPNGDGANDLFIVQGLEAYPANTLVIINRWGNVVYDRLNYKNDWGGENSQGQPLPNGTYFAILQVENGARTLQGYVDLRR